MAFRCSMGFSKVPNTYCNKWNLGTLIVLTILLLVSCLLKVWTYVTPWDLWVVTQTGDCPFFHLLGHCRWHRSNVMAVGRSSLSQSQIQHPVALWIAVNLSSLHSSVRKVRMQSWKYRSKNKQHPRSIKRAYVPIAGMENSRAGANNETIYIHAATFLACCCKYRLTSNWEVWILLKVQSIALENKCWFWTNYLFIAKSFSFIISLQIGSALEDRIRFKSRVSLKHSLQMKVFSKHYSNALEHKLLSCFLWLCTAPGLKTGISGIHSG